MNVPIPPLPNSAPTFALTLLVSLIVQTTSVLAQEPQNPSPMVEHIREHPRLEKQPLDTDRVPLRLGTLSISRRTQSTSDSTSVPLVITFHCGEWIPELAVNRLEDPPLCLMIQLGAGSAKYSQPFRDDEGLFVKLVEEASKIVKKPISEVVLVSWSAGYGAIGQILSSDIESVNVSTILLIDGLHASYESGKPGPQESKLQTKSLQPFLEFARKSLDGQRRMMLVHSEVFPGSYASTTETADWLLQQLALKRQSVLRWGPMKTQVLGETIQGKLVVRAFAGNSAPDHVDLLHALPEFLKEIMETSLEPVTTKP